MKIGWIGTGVMGSSMAGHLRAAGHDLYVFNRTPAKAEPLLEAGASWCATPAEVAEQAEVAFTMVGFPVDVEEVYLGQQGLLTHPARCRLLIDMTTSRPTLAKTIAARAEQLGCQSLDAPVSGGDIGARNATLAIMVGGEAQAYEQALPLLQVMGKTIALMGPAGAGQHTKLCNQVLIAGAMIGVCEALLYAVKIGLDQQALIELLSKGAAGSWSLSNLGPRIIRGDFTSGFFVKHFVKDMSITLQEAAALGLSLPGLALVHQLYLAVLAQGHGEVTTQALYLALRRLNGME